MNRKLWKLNKQLDELIIKYNTEMNIIKKHKSYEIFIGESSTIDLPKNTEKYLYSDKIIVNPDFVLVDEIKTSPLKNTSFKFQSGVYRFTISFSSNPTLEKRITVQTFNNGQREILKYITFKNKSIINHNIQLDSEINQIFDESSFIISINPTNSFKFYHILIQNSSNQDDELKSLQIIIEKIN